MPPQIHLLAREESSLLKRNMQHRRVGTIDLAEDRRPLLMDRTARYLDLHSPIRKRMNERIQRDFFDARQRSDSVEYDG